MNKRITAAAVFFLAAATALAEPVGAEQAAEKVVAAVKAHKLTSLETECLTLVYSNEGRENDEGYYEIAVHEKHDEHCGGDPETSPRLFSFRVDAASEKMQTDASGWQGGPQEWTGDLHDID